MKTGLEIPIIRYANCWEDAGVLLKALELGRPGRFISIASGGDNTFALLTLDPECVVAFDLNQVQLWLCELKSAAIRHLEYEECVAFLGYAASGKRLVTYQKLRGHLSENCRHYFDQQKKCIQKGIVQCGKFERYFHKFRTFVMPLIHGHRSIRKLLSPKSAEAQELYYRESWNTRRWQWLFKIFYSRVVMGFFGRSPRFHKYVEFNVGRFIYERAAKHLSSGQCQDNEYLHYIFKGYFAPRLPFYICRENFPVIRERLDRIQWILGDTKAAVEACGEIDACNLSDIFEYMSGEQTAEQAKMLSDAMRCGGRLAYWNLMVDRKLSDHDNRLEYQKDESMALKDLDKGFFYNSMVVEKKI